jgi:4-hydroxybenzoate polyprenyltransferase
MEINKIWKEPKYRKPLMTLLFYFLSYITIQVLNKISPSGPCVPGLSFLAFLALIPICIILFLINAYKTLEGDKTNIISTILHLIVGVFFILVFDN